jgi:hypothetical protein
MEEIAVVSWKEEDVPEGAEAIGWWGGFFENGMRWKDYLENFDEAVHPYLRYTPIWRRPGSLPLPIGSE